MNIDIKLDADFIYAYNDLLSKYGEHMSMLNGFADKQIDYTLFIDNFVDSKVVADASIDGNANVGHKDIVSLLHEMSKPHLKLLAFNKIFYEIKKMMGLKRAKEWLEAEWSGDFYLHDAHSSTVLPYCFAYDIEKLVNEGLYFMPNFNHKPPQHLDTFIDFVSEFVSYCCNRSSGRNACPLTSLPVVAGVPTRC